MKLVLGIEYHIRKRSEKKTGMVPHTNRLSTEDETRRQLTSG